MLRLPLCLVGKKCNVIVKRGIIPSDIVSCDGIEVDKAKVDLIQIMFAIDECERDLIKDFQKLQGHSRIYLQAM